MSEERLPPMLRLAAEYEIIRELGRGGTAVVYLARQRATGAEVAIKLIHARYAEDAEATARFAREAEFVAQLQHPNVVPMHAVLDLGEGGLALVMAHVSGRTLKQAIFEDGAFAPERAERIMRDVASALGATHALGIVHRDVKPENIFIEEGGSALLADFGVARSMENETHQLTMHGVAIGTPTYMAPEQIDGGKLDGRGDIYSLGLVAWEMLTGRRPWEGEALYSVLYHQKHVPLPDVRALRSDVPEHLASAIDGAVEKERESRWQNIDELLAALDGNPPARRTSAVLPSSTETVRFARPALLATQPTVEPVAIVPVAPSEPAPSEPAPVISAALLEAMYLESQPRRFTPSRRVVAAGALVSLLALFLIFGGVQAWSDSAAHRRGDERESATAGTRSVSAGELAAAGSTSAGELAAARSVQSPAAATAAGRTGAADAPLGVTIGAPASGPAPTPATEQRAKSDTQRQGPRVAAATIASPGPRPGVITSMPVTVPDVPTGAAPAGLRSRTRIVPGGRHTCLITAEGRVFCWGGNDRGQLGIAASARATTPAPLALDQRFVVIAPGLSHSCAVDVEGAAWCWGENDRGQLGDGTIASHAAAARVDGARRFRTVSAGAAHTCALDFDRAAWCWGANGFGQVGDGEARDRNAPSAVATSRRFTELSTGWNFTCALDEDGRAFCWGDDSAGQLGDGSSTTSRRAPVSVQGRVTFASITAGNAHACGVTASGDAYCWGANASGQLGDGSTTERHVPARVSGSAAFVAITAGAVHSCALTGEGEAFCWGRNTYGQLGDGGTDDHPLPVRVAGGHVFTNIRAFGSHTCGATASGEAFCWGYNVDGQLGDGTRTHRTRPVYVERPGAR